MSTNLIDSPDKALEPIVAGMALVRGSLEGWYTGKKLGDYINGGKVDYVNARRVINGTDRAQLIAGYAEKFEKALKLAAVAPIEAPPLQPAPPIPTVPIPEPEKGKSAPLGIIIAAIIIVALIGAFFFVRL